MKYTSAFFCSAIITLISTTICQRDALADEEKTMARVTGIGGVFFLSQGKGEELAQWYAKHLGMKLEDWGGAILQWEEDTAPDNGLTVWSVADKDSKWFKPSKSSFMINYRVDNMAKMIEQLTAADIEILQGPESHENGIFAWIMDPAGNKIELWEPKIPDDKNDK